MIFIDVYVIPFFFSHVVNCSHNPCLNNGVQLTNPRRGPEVFPMSIRVRRRPGVTRRFTWDAHVIQTCSRSFCWQYSLQLFEEEEAGRELEHRSE